MNKIKFTFEEKEYILEYSRKSIVKLEELGLRNDDIENKIFTSLSLLFYGAFLTRHKDISQLKTDRILDQIHDTEKLIEKLIEMYANTINKLLGETEEKNIKWDVVN